MEIPGQGLNSEGWCSRQVIIASRPLNDDNWMPLQAGNIACFQQGQRIY